MIKEKAMSSVLWTTIQKVTGYIILFISGIILARLLDPEDYGCIGMLTIFMSLTTVFVDAGFGTALIQKKRPTQEDYSTVFYFNLVMSTIMYLILFISAPYIARFYHMDLLCSVLRVQGVTLIINAFATIQTNQLMKQFRFKKIAIVSLSASVIALSITIIMAYKKFGVWALVTQHILTALIPAIVYWLTNHWHPLLKFSVESFKSLFNFGGYMLSMSLVVAIGNEIQGLLIGRFYDPSTMGYYSKARGTEKLASHVINNVLQQITLPIYSELQDDRNRLIAAIKKMTTSVAYLTFPLMFLLIVLSKPVFIILYSERWLPSVPYFQILCLAGIAGCRQFANNQAIAAIGKSKEMFLWTLVKRIVGIGLVAGGLVLFGMSGLLVGTVLSVWFMYMVNIYLVSKHIGYKWIQQLKDLMPTFILSLTAFGASFVVNNVLWLNMYVNSVVALIVFVATYCIGSKVFQFEELSTVQLMASTLKGKFTKNHHNNDTKKN